MKIYIVTKMVDREDEQSSTTVSAHVDKDRADAAAKAIDARREDLIYGVVETVELDLTGVLVQPWGVADRITDDGIQFGVDGPSGYPLRLAVEDGELRARQVRD